MKEAYEKMRNHACAIFRLSCHFTGMFVVTDMYAKWSALLDMQTCLLPISCIK